jgi:molybdopterin biosynthesis enzyme
VEDDVEVVLGSVQPLASTKVPLRSARGLVLAEPVTPGHGLHPPFGETPIVERAAG